MTIVVEDGTGKSNAVSYISVTDADTYWAAEVDETWSSFSTAEKEVALVRATREIDALLSTKFVGNRATLAQSLSWPRVDAYDDNSFNISGIVPPVLKSAVADLARSLLTEDPRTTVDNSNIGEETIRVGPIEVSTKYSTIRDAPRKKIFDMLVSIINVGASEVRIHRT